MNNDKITPINKLRKGVRNMIVRARVVSKGYIRYLGQENVFKIEINDGSIEFSTLVYFACNNCEDFYNLIELGKIYKFSKAQILSDAQKGLTRNCLKYEMYDPSFIQLMEETPEDEKTKNFNKFELLKINAITDRNILSHFDVIGIIMEEPTRDKSINTRGIELESWKFLIGDESKHTLQVSVRNEYGLNIKLKVFDVVLIKTTHINVFGNQKSIDSGSGIFVNPDIKEAYELLANFERLIQEDDQPRQIQNMVGDGLNMDLNKMQNGNATQNRLEKDNMISERSSNNNKEFIQLGDNKISQHFYEVRPISYVVQQIDDHLERVVRLSMTLQPTDPVFLKEYNKCIYTEIEGEIYSASAEKKPYYVACSICNKKYENYPIQMKCSKNCNGSVPIAKITTSFNIADGTGAISAVAFNEQCSEIFGFDGEFLRLLDETQKKNQYHKKDPTYRDFIRLCFTHKYRFRILSGIQVYEKKLQVKHNIISCFKVNVAQDIRETIKSIEIHILRQQN